MTGVAAPFSLTTINGEPAVVGHGIRMQVPKTWVTYEPERPSTDGTTFEWAVGLPASTKPLPAGVQFSMGMPDSGAQIDSLPMAAKELAKRSQGYKFLDEGDASVSGARAAKFLRFERDIFVGGATHHVEQVSLFVESQVGVTSTIRFIATAGDWDAQMKQAYTSVELAVG